MSYNTLNTQVHDPAFQERVIAATNKEAWNNPALGGTDYGAKVRTTAAAAEMLWPVSVANEAAYESAVIAGVPDPGKDEAVITDAAILSAVQASWPPDAP